MDQFGSMSWGPKPPGPCPPFLPNTGVNDRNRPNITHNYIPRKITTTQHNQKSNYLIKWIVIISYSGVSPIQPPFWLRIVVEWSGGTVMKRRMIIILLWVNIWCLRVSIGIPWRRWTSRSIRWSMPSFRDFRTLTSHDRLLQNQHKQKQNNQSSPSLKLQLQTCQLSN